MFLEGQGLTDARMVFVVSRHGVDAVGQLQSPEEGDLGLSLLHVSVHKIPGDDEHVGFRGLHCVQHGGQPLLLDDPPEVHVGELGNADTVHPRGSFAVGMVMVTVLMFSASNQP